MVELVDGLCNLSGFCRDRGDITHGESGLFGQRHFKYLNTMATSRRSKRDGGIFRR